MSDHSHIQWTDATWNPVTGCSKVSTGCKHCYAERDWKRLSANPKTVYYGRKFTDIQCHPERLDQPLRWRKPRMIFVNSMSDLFHEDVPGSFIDQVFAVMQASPQHIFQVCTKRPKRMLEYMIGSNHRVALAGTNLAADKGWCHAHEDRDWPLSNVWLGVSCEDQVAADNRIPLLLQTPAVIRWISAEPLLGMIDLSPFLEFVSTVPDCLRSIKPIDWVVVGGESGRDARPMMHHWARSLRNQCLAAGVPFFFKHLKYRELLNRVMFGAPTDGEEV